jgi:hypothetical protein
VRNGRGSTLEPPEPLGPLRPPTRPLGLSAASAGQGNTLPALQMLHSAPATTRSGG